VQIPPKRIASLGGFSIFQYIQYPLRNNRRDKLQFFGKNKNILFLFLFRGNKKFARYVRAAKTRKRFKIKLLSDRIIDLFDLLLRTVLLHILQKI